MDPINPIEGILKNAEGQASAPSKMARERYWQQQAQTLPPVEASEETAVSTEKHQNQEDKTSEIRHTYAEYEVDEKTHDITVRIIEAESGKLLRTIPPDELAKEIIRGNFQLNQLRRRTVTV